MSVKYLHPALDAKNGRVLRVIGVCRISTEHQDERSLLDQESLLRDWVKEHWSGEVQFKIIASRGSGEILDRDELFELEAEAASRKYDLVIAEDLARICRRLQANIFCEACEDYGTRVIAINDQLDTGQENWRLNGFFATLRHETYNRDTSKRIRRSQRSRFERGEVCQTFPYGYEKPAGARSDSDVHKDPVAEPIYDRWFQLLDDGATFEEVADWLNSQNIPLGRYCRQKKWAGTLVGQVTRNPLLKGLRERNRRISKRVNKTGRHISVAAPPEELLQRNCPHLAFIEPDRYDRILRKLENRNAKYRRKPVDGVDPRKNVSRKRTRWPGQHLTCGCCGSLLVYGAHGQKEHLACTAACGYRCWMVVSVNGLLAQQKLTAALLNELQTLPNFDDEMERALRLEADVTRVEREKQFQEFDRRAAQLDREKGRLMAALREFGGSDMLMAEIRTVEQQLRQLKYDQDQWNEQTVAPCSFPKVEDIRNEMTAALQAVVDGSQEAVRAIHRLIPRIRVFPYRLIDGGHPVLRAHVTLDLSEAMTGLAGLQTSEPSLQREIVVDLFDPPQREAFRKQVVILRATGLTERCVADQLGITHTAAQRAARLQRLLDQRGLQDPYELLSEPPADYTRIRRHKHSRFDQRKPFE